MSRENVEALRRGLELWAQRGHGTDVFGTEAFDPQMEWDISAHPLPDWPNTGSGRDDFQRHMANYVSGWRDYRAEVRELIDAGDGVVVVLHETVAMRDSDAVLDRDLHGVWTVRDGVVVRLQVFKTRVEALEAAGLEE
jgi:ketosteroid isomerase-like protein